MKAPQVKEMQCWSCGRTMRFCGVHGVYFFYRCPTCKAERAVWIEDEPQTADRVAPEKPDTPPAFRGPLSGDARGERVDGQAKE